MDTNDVLHLVRSGAWIPLIAAAVGAAIRLSKTDAAVAWCPWVTKPEHRAWWALGLGVVGGIADRIVAGANARDAVIVGLFGGLIAGQTSIAAHEVVIEGWRKGREVGLKKPPKGPTPPTELPDADLVSIRPSPPANPPPAPTIRYLGFLAVLVMSCSGSISCSGSSAATREATCNLFKLGADLCPMVIIPMKDGTTVMMPRDKLQELAQRYQQPAPSDAGSDQ